ncbi:hypothetical protein [Blattabacterium cuenoti]|uniref:hypothetical protein n=1 Tax=Blattabacterium cuenoti TaxID=1653831 RepID=UPI00311D6BBB
MMELKHDVPTGSSIVESVKSFTFVDKDMNNLLKDHDTLKKVMEATGVKDPEELLIELEALKSSRDASRRISSAHMLQDINSLKKEHIEIGEKRKKKIPANSTL